jgi:hypothetical protein
LSIPYVTYGHTMAYVPVFFFAFAFLAVRLLTNVLVGPIDLFFECTRHLHQQLRPLAYLFHQLAIAPNSITN